MNKLFIALCFIYSFFNMSAYAVDENAHQKQQVIHAIKMQWEKPHHQVDVPVVALIEDFSIAAWIQGKHGGRAVLRKNNGTWQTLACGDAQIKTLQTLKTYGMNNTQANALIRQLNQEEQSLSKAMLGKINGFSGIMNVDSHHHHH
jgi:hypothetical protein